MAITNIYKGALERSDIQKIYKGTTLLYEKVLPPQGETWVINEWYGYGVEGQKYFTTQIGFTSNNTHFNSLSLREAEDTYDGPAIYYDDLQVCDYEDSTYWEEYVFSRTPPRSLYQTVIFDIPPTGDLLTWLTSEGRNRNGSLYGYPNAVKQ